MPRSRTTNQAAGTTLNQGGTNGPVPTRQRTTRRRHAARGAQGKNLANLSGAIGNQRFAGMSAQQVYDMGLRHGCELHGKGITR